MNKPFQFLSFDFDEKGNRVIMTNKDDLKASYKVRLYEAVGVS